MNMTALSCEVDKVLINSYIAEQLKTRSVSSENTGLVLLNNGDLLAKYKHHPR